MSVKFGIAGRTVKETALFPTNKFDINCRGGRCVALIFVYKNGGEKLISSPLVGRVPICYLSIISIFLFLTIKSMRDMTVSATAT